MRQRKHPRSLAATVVCVSFLGVLNALGGCAYIEAQLQRRAPPDTRIKLGWQDRVHVYAQQLADYTCDSRYILMCDRGGSISYSCTCLLR
jgi:hypothetical protein